MKRQVDACCLEEFLGSLYLCRFGTHRAGRQRERGGGEERVNCCTGAAKRGGWCCRAEGSAAPVSGCIWETAMHLCMFRDYRMLLANNGHADQGTTYPGATIFAATCSLISRFFPLPREYSFGTRFGAAQIDIFSTDIIDRGIFNIIKKCSKHIYRWRV